MSSHYNDYPMPVPNLFSFYASTASDLMAVKCKEWRHVLIVLGGRLRVSLQKGYVMGKYYNLQWVARTSSPSLYLRGYFWRSISTLNTRIGAGELKGGPHTRHPHPFFALESNRLHCAHIQGRSGEGTYIKGFWGLNHNICEYFVRNDAELWRMTISLSKLLSFTCFAHLSITWENKLNCHWTWC